MKIILQTLRNHPFSIIAYLLYAALFIWTVDINLRFEEMRKHYPKMSGIALGGEGVGFADFFTFLLGALLIIILLVNAAFRKQQRRFYYGQVLAIIIPILLYANIIFLILVPFLYLASNWDKGNRQNCPRPNL